MADEPTNQQPISDDQELAKVLAGVNQENTATEAEPEVVAPPTMPAGIPTISPPASDEPTEEPAPAADEPVEPVISSLPSPDPSPVVEPEPSIAAPVVPAASGELDSIKQEALGELRPLVDKLDVSPEEKFDTYLLLLRSTDDKDLIAPAHEAAKNISDEARRAQALLDVIKEIDFLSQNQNQS